MFYSEYTIPPCNREASDALTYSSPKSTTYSDTNETTFGSTIEETVYAT